MTQTSRTVSPTSSPGADADLDDFGGMMLAVPQAWAKAQQDANRACVDFWRQRLACWGEVGRQLGECRSLGEALRIQSEYLRDTIDSYATLGTKLPAVLANTKDSAGKGGAPSAKRPS